MSSAIGSRPAPKISPLAGKPAPKETFVDVARLERQYFERRPDPSEDKDGPIKDLLAAEITARTTKDPAEDCRRLTSEFGATYYTRSDAPATPEQKAKLGKSSLASRLSRSRPKHLE